MKKSKSIIKICQCGKSFLVRCLLLEQGKGKYCNAKCMYFYRKRKEELIKCLCGKEFLRYNSPSREGRGKYCSRICFHKYRDNSYFKEYEIKPGNQPWNKGLKGVQAGENHPAWRGGITKIQKQCIQCEVVFMAHGPNVKKGLGKFCSHICKGKWMSENLIGEKSPQWKGGITPINQKIRTSKEYIEWREAIYRRDNYTCQLCGDNKGGNLHANHIRKFSDYPELRFEVSNGITLCRNCHMKRVTWHEIEYEQQFRENLIRRNL